MELAPGSMDAVKDMKRRAANESGNKTSSGTRRFSVVCDRGMFARIQERVKNASADGDRQATLSSVTRMLIQKGLGAADAESVLRKRGAVEALQRLKKAIQDIERAMGDSDSER